MIEFYKLVPLESRTASGTVDDLKTVTPGQALGPSNPGAKFYLNVSANSGTSPTLDVFIIKVINGVQHIIGQFTQVTTVNGAKTPIDIANCPDDIQVAWVLGGTNPDYTFEVFMSR